MMNCLVNLLNVCFIAFVFLVLGPYMTPDLYNALIIFLAPWKVWLLVIAVVMAMTIGSLMAILLVQGGSDNVQRSQSKPGPRLGGFPESQHRSSQGVQLAVHHSAAGFKKHC